MIGNILILRAEFICIIILLFLFISNIHYNVGKDSRTFYRLWFPAMIHVISDMCKVLILNCGNDHYHSGIMKSVLSVMCISAVLFAREFFIYTLQLCLSAERIQIYKKYSAIFAVFYIWIILILPFEHIDGEGTDYATGPMVLATFALAFFFLAWSAIMLFVKRKNVDSHIIITLYPMLATMILVEAVQLYLPELQFTGACLTLIMVGVFFTMENPQATMKAKAMLDLFTGLRSRNAFEEDFKILEKEFKSGKMAENELGFVFCDINDLKTVNDNYGHQIGDEYIGMAAKALLENMRSAFHVYRFGGDEFLALYRSVPEDNIKREIENVRHRCAELNEKQPYNMSIAIGYEMSGSKYESLSDVMHAADHDMYDKKWKMKHGSLPKMTAFDDGMDKTGLTDRIFEAFAMTDDRNCLYLCNLKTNVTRVSRSFITNFDLPGQYINDAFMIWEEFIHPEDRERYHNDMEDIFNGREKFHNIKYKAKNKNGVYVNCTSRGTVLHGEGTDPDLFAGILIFSDENQ